MRKQSFSRYSSCVNPNIYLDQASGIAVSTAAGYLGRHDLRRMVHSAFALTAAEIHVLASPFDLRSIHRSVRTSPPRKQLVGMCKPKHLTFANQKSTQVHFEPIGDERLRFLSAPELPSNLLTISLPGSPAFVDASRRAVGPSRCHESQKPGCQLYVGLQRFR